MFDYFLFECVIFSVIEPTRKVFGEVTIDLRNAKINEDVVINTSSIFGGIDLFIPEDINVKVKSTSIFGGVDDKRKNRNNDSKYTIYINSTCLFGGVDIK